VSKIATVFFGHFRTGERENIILTMSHQTGTWDYFRNQFLHPKHAAWHQGKIQPNCYCCVYIYLFSTDTVQKYTKILTQQEAQLPHRNSASAAHMEGGG